MVDNRKLSEITVDEFESKCKDIPLTFFKDAVREVIQEENRQLAEELTGKDISVVADRRCIRETFDHSQRCRLNRETASTTWAAALRNESVKALIHIGLALGGVWGFLKAKGLI